MSDVVSRWRGRLGVRKRLAALARSRYVAHPTSAAKRLLLYRRAQVAFAERILRRHARIEGVSPEGVQLIASFEGFVDHPYRDAVGVWTIGFGHTKGVGAGTPRMSRADGERLLRLDLDREYAPPVLALNLPAQEMVDAVVSLVYNCGPGILAAGHSIGDALRARDWPRAAEAFLLYDKAGGRTLPGLTSRRRAERAVFLKGVR